MGESGGGGLLGEGPEVEGLRFRFGFAGGATGRLSEKPRLHPSENLSGLGL